MASADLTGKKVPLVTFSAKGMKPKGGLLQLAEVPSTLTARGAKAFGGVYRAGTRMDPVTLSIALTDDARLPALPDLGESASPSPTPRASRAPDAKVAPRAENTASGGPVGGSALPVALALGALLAAAVAFGVVRRRRTPTD